MALGDISKVGKAFFQAAQLLVFQGACCFLSIAGDEGDGVARIEKFRRRFDLRRADEKFIG